LAKPSVHLQGRNLSEWRHIPLVQCEGEPESLWIRKERPIVGPAAPRLAQLEGMSLPSFFIARMILKKEPA